MIAKYAPALKQDPYNSCWDCYGYGNAQPLSWQAHLVGSEVIISWEMRQPVSRQGSYSGWDLVMAKLQVPECIGQWKVDYKL